MNDKLEDNIKERQDESRLGVEAGVDIVCDPLAQGGRTGIRGKLFGHVLLYAEQRHQEGQLEVVQNLNKFLISAVRLWELIHQSDADRVEHL